MYWWLIGGAAWYALAAWVVRKTPCPPGAEGTLGESLDRLVFWLLSPVAFPVGFAVWFVAYALTPREKNP